ncbi:hypothetical protein [Streptomyces roseoverticillatus]|uniref:Uncharacterized protein n=1 Tax=Streptomyces roseoverticillatus TaxID=66429 RepID=A0ABV3J1J6_9ACTN
MATLHQLSGHRLDRPALRACAAFLVAVERGDEHRELSPHVLVDVFLVL